MPMSHFNIIKRMKDDTRQKAATVAKIVKTLGRASPLFFVLFIAMKLIIPSLSLATVYLFNLILRSIIEPQFEVGQTVGFVTAYVLAVLLSQAVSELFGLVDRKLRAQFQMYTTVLYNKTVAGLPLWFIDSPGGAMELDSYITSFDFYMNIFTNLLDAISSVYTVTGTLVIICRLGYFLPFAAVLLFAVPSVIYAHKNRKEEEEFFISHLPMDAMKGNYLGILTSKVNAMDTRLYNIQDVFYDRYCKWRDICFGERRNMINRHKKKSVAYSVLMILAQCGFITYAMFRVAGGAIGINDFSMLTGYMFMAVSSCVGIGAILSNISVRTGWVIEYDTVVRDQFRSNAGNGAELINAGNMKFESLVFRDVHFTYPETENEVLSGVSFTINRGEKVSLVGVNGAGKTTCVKLILGIYQPTSGDILINGKPIACYSESGLRQLFSSMFQNYIIFSFSLKENILLGKALDAERYQRTLDVSGVSRFVEKLPRGEETVLSRGYGSDGIELSAGQRQSVALARICYKNSPFEIYDEPSASLDVLAEDAFAAYYKKISKEKTCILISHRLSAVRSSDKIMVLNGGKITECGTHDRLMEQKGIYAQMFTAQQQGYLEQSGTLNR